MLILYFNAKCSKSRAAKTFLEQKKINFVEFLYLEKLTDNNINELLTAGINLENLIREKDSELSISQIKELNKEQLFSYIINNKKILQRPLLFFQTKNFTKVIIARDLALVDQFLIDIELL